MASSKKQLADNPRYSLIREYKGVEMDLAELPGMGAHSIGIGRKISEGEETDELALRYYVARKRPMDHLSSGERIPSTVRFFSRKKRTGTRITTDVIEMAPAQFEAVDPESKVRPAPGGVSIGVGSSSGTLGGWVWDSTDNTIVLLTNEHVLGTESGLDIVQPSALDDGALPADRLGTVKRSIARSDSEANRVDCAIGDPASSDLHDLQTLEAGPAVYATGVPRVDLLVQKYGQTTRLTHGVITDVDWEGTVSGRLFTDCCRVDVTEPSDDWSKGGDSGSLVFAREPVDDDSGIRPAVALHFAGAATHGIVCKIHNVFEALQLTTLSAGAFAAFMDSLFDLENTGGVSDESERSLRGLSTLAATRGVRRAPLPFVRPERDHQRAGSLYAGISKQIAKRITGGGGKGPQLGELFRKHRGELLPMLASRGDVWRAAVVAFQPLVAGATTTTDVLERVFTEGDLAALDRLAREVERHAGSKLKSSLKLLRSLAGDAAGKSIADILGLDL